MKLYKFFSFVLLGAIICSCSDEYLEFQPIASLNSSSFYLNMDQAEQAVTVAYSSLVSRTAFDRDIALYMSDIASDDCEAGGDFENEVPAAEEFNRMTHLSTNEHIDNTYGLLFRGIYFCNTAMEKIPNVLELDPNADEEIINRRMGELKFLRALYYLYLTHLFGEVPLVDHILTADEYDQVRAPLRDIFDLIELDLLAAITVLPERLDLAPADLGRATKGAAQALLARMYLFESSYAAYYSGDERFANLNERWGDVLTYCNEVIGSDQYRLVGEDSETYPTWREPNTNGFRYIFTMEGDNSDEAVFEIQYIQDGLSYTHTRGGSLCKWVSSRYYTDGANQFETSYWGLGWPTESLVSTFDAGDPRLKTTVTSAGDSIEISQGARFPVNFNNTLTRHYQSKYELSAAQFVDVSSHDWHKSGFNFKLIRYSDVFLMAAEASLMSGNNEDARNFVNRVRRRARNCGTTGVPAEINGTITFQQIVDERRMEFACEGRRFFDLVRWNLATQYIGGSSTAGGFPIQFVSPKNDFIPLPALEVSVSNGALVQYPDWQ